MAEPKPNDVGSTETANISAPTVGALTQHELPPMVDLHSGAELNPDTACQITRATLTRLVILAGDVGSGKTTLLTSIYEKLNEGPFGNFLFAGSITIPAWEQRCHRARVASGAEKPTTVRTTGQEQRLLHLRVRDLELERPAQDLLLSDLSGETFRLVRDSQAECERLLMLRRADHFVLLLDGEKLARPDMRHDAFHNGALLLRACIDAGMVGKHSYVDVIFSKDDQLRNGGQALDEYLEHIVTEIRKRDEQRVGRLRFHRVAARPVTSDVEFAYGISEVFASWVSDSPLHCVIPTYRIKLPLEASAFERFLKKRLPALVES